MKEREIDWKALNEIEQIGFGGPTDPEEDRMVSEYLKKRRESADPDSVLTPWEELEAERRAAKP